MPDSVESRTKIIALIVTVMTVAGIVGGGVSSFLSYLQNEEARSMTAGLRAEVHADLAALRADVLKEFGELRQVTHEEDLSLVEALRDLRKESQEARGALDTAWRREFMRLDASVMRVEAMLDKKVDEDTRLAMLANLQRDIQRIETRLDRLEGSLYGNRGQ